MSDTGNMGNETVPLISISVITYNHEKYVRQCLDGILMQDVNFSYEVLVHDDASPDGTTNIIREDEAKDLGIIKPIYQIENQYSQGKDVSKFNFDRARGKYLAFCEGDDYWADPRKLQKQVDFLETHPEYIACVLRVQVTDEFGNINQSNNYALKYDTFDYTLSDAENFRTRDGCAGHLSSLVCRNIFSIIPEEIYLNYINCKANGDIKLTLLLTLSGPIRRLDDTMSVYRNVTSGGTSWSARHSKSNNCLLIYNYLHELSHFSQKSYGIVLNYTEYINEITIESIYQYIRHPNKDNKNIMCRLLATRNKTELIKHLIKYNRRYIKALISKLHK